MFVSISDILILATTTFVWFVSSEFTWLWLAAGNKYFQCDRVREVVVLYEDGGLTVEGGVGEL